MADRPDDPIRGADAEANGRDDDVAATHEVDDADTVDNADTVDETEDTREKRVDTIAFGNGEVVIYDREESAAWLQSDVGVDLTDEAWIR